MNQKLGFCASSWKICLRLGDGASGPLASYCPRGGSATVSLNIGATRMPAMPTAKNAKRQSMIDAM